VNVADLVNGVETSLECSYKTPYGFGVLREYGHRLCEKILVIQDAQILINSGGDSPVA